ncbi:MAG: hypothetical protein ACYYKD_10080 [Rhodospirillales bacterium]
MDLFGAIRPGLDAYHTQRAHRLTAGEKFAAVNQAGGDGGGNTGGGGAAGSPALTAPAVPPVTGLMNARISPDTLGNMNALKARESGGDENTGFISAARDAMSEGRSVGKKTYEDLLKELNARIDKAAGESAHTLLVPLSEAEQKALEKAMQKLREIMEMLMEALAEAERAAAEQPDAAKGAEAKHAALDKAAVALNGVMEDLQKKLPNVAKRIKKAVDGMQEAIATIRRGLPAQATAENPLKLDPEQTPLTPEAKRKQDTAELEQRRRVKEAHEEEVFKAAETAKAA